MATLKRHPGAIPELIARDPEGRCEATVLEIDQVGTRRRKLRCVYTAGHAGLHYSANECWATSGQENT